MQHGASIVTPLDAGASASPFPQQPRCLRRFPCAIISPGPQPMPSAASLLRLINEIIILLLGALLILLAVSRGVALPARPAAMIALGVALAYWGVRARMRRDTDVSPSQVKVRSGSLILVGAIVVAVPLLPIRYAESLMITAGAILVLRGILGAILFLRPSKVTQR